MNDSNKNKETKILTKPCFYPLNQFHKEYVEKAKQGISDINWRDVLEEIQNDVDDDTALILEEEEK